MAMLALCLHINVPGPSAHALNGARPRCSSSRSRRASPSCRCCCSCWSRRRSAAVGSFRQRATQRQSARQPARGRGAQDVRARHRAPRRGDGRAAHARGAARRRSAMPRRMGRPRRHDAARSGSSSRTSAPATLSPAQRMAAQFEELDAALLRFSTGANRRVERRRGLRCGALVRRGRASRCSSRSKRPSIPAASSSCSARTSPRGRDARARRTGGCSPRSRGAARSSTRVMTHWRPEQYVEISARQVARANPWSGLPGLRLHGHSRRRTRGPGAGVFRRAARAAPDAQLCNAPAMFVAAGDPARCRAACRDRGQAPTTRSDMRADDERWKRPAVARRDAAAARDAATADGVALPAVHRRAASGGTTTPAGYRYGPNRIDIGGTPIDVGFSVDLTIDPAVQALAQRTAACYTGRQDVCRRSGFRAARTRGSRSVIGCSSARCVRMAAIAVIDIASGRIEALAGALSPCTLQEYDGPGRAKACDKRLPYRHPLSARRAAQSRRLSRRDAGVGHQADHGRGVPVRSGTSARAGSPPSRRRCSVPGSPPPDSLRGQLMRSNSARFLDRMLCADQAFHALPAPVGVQAMALAFGWNDGCAEAHARLRQARPPVRPRGRRERRVGPVAPLATLVPYGRLLAEPLGNKLGAPFRLRRADRRSTSPRCSRCAAGRRRRSASATTTGRSAAARSSWTSSRKAGDRDMRGRARSASPA